MKRKIDPITNGPVRLRLIEESDLQQTLAWRNREDARVWFKSSNELTLTQHLDWFDRYLTKDNDFLFIIEAMGKPVGQASVYGIDWETGSAEVGRFLVAPESAGRGYIGGGCEALIRLCTDVLHLRYLFLEVLPGNEPAIHLYRKNGFAVEHCNNDLIRMGKALGASEKYDATK